MIYTIRVDRKDRGEIDPVRINSWDRKQAQDFALKMYPGSVLAKPQQRKSQFANAARPVVA